MKIDGLSCGLVILIVAAFLALIPLMWWALYAVWNWIVPEVFHGPHITYWQAAGISILLGFVGGAFRSVVTTRKD